MQGRTFLGWSGDPGCSGIGTTLILADVDSSISCTARYAARFTVAGTPLPSEFGTVTATSQTPNSLCGASSCDVDEGAEVTLQTSASLFREVAAGWPASQAAELMPRVWLDAQKKPEQAQLDVRLSLRACWSARPYRRPRYRRTRSEGPRRRRDLNRATSTASA